MSITSRKRDLVYLVFFLIHIPVMFCESSNRSYAINKAALSLKRHFQDISNHVPPQAWIYIRCTLNQ